MIQRIQTLYLLGVSLLHLLLFYFPFWTGMATGAGAPGQSVEVNVMDTLILPDGGEIDNLTLTVLNIVIIIASFGAIFLFRRRMTQLRLARLLLLFSLAFIAYMFYTVEQAKTLFSGTDFTSTYEAGTYLPLAALLLLFLAGQSILKDIKLIKSADRLR